MSIDNRYESSGTEMHFFFFANEIRFFFLKLVH